MKPEILKEGHWFAFPPTAEALLADIRGPITPSVRAAIQREIEFFSLDLKTANLLEALAEIASGAPTAAAQMAISSLDRHAALKVFMMLPYPTLPAFVKGKDLQEHFNFRHQHWAAGCWLLFKEHGLKYSAHWLEMNCSKFSPYAELAQKRYEAVLGLYQFGVLLPETNDWSVAGMWLFVEFSSAQAAYQNREMISSGNLDRQKRSRRLAAMEGFVSGTPPETEPLKDDSLIAANHVGKAFYSLASETAGQDPDFDRQYFKPLMAAERSWNAATKRKLKVLAEKRTRGAGKR